MEISTVHTCQDTENECETETELCGVDEIQKCDHAEETEQWLSEDFHRQRCEVKARRDVKLCCKILLLWDEENGKRGMMCHWSCERTLKESTEILNMHLLIGWRSCFVMQMCEMMQFRL